MKRGLWHLPAAVLLAACAAGSRTGGKPALLCPDAGWCWFQDERALVLPGHRVVFGSVANGSRDPARRGDVQVTTWDTVTGAVQTVELHDRFEADDHDAPALLQLDDGRLLATWCRHGGDDRLRWRLGSKPDDASAWQPEQSLRLVLQEGRGVTYANVHRIDAGLLCFCRAEGWDPTAIRGSPDGSWLQVAGRLVAGPGRPYAKYASVRGGDRVHFVVTEQHPRDFDNSLWHGTVDAAGNIRRSDGSTAGHLRQPPAPAALTRVFRGRADAVAWPCDLELDRRGRPVCVFSVQVDGAGKPPGQGGLDHRYWYARHDGASWQVHEMAFAGSRLYAGEDDYTGLAAIVPDDPRVVFVSTDAHPATGAPLISRRDGRRHHEIWRGRTVDGGATWSWRPVTADSTADNLRPVIPRWRRDRCALLWLRGTYRSYTDYDLDAVGLLLPLPR